MINLMPYSHIKQTRAARTNVILIRYVIVMLFALIFISASCYVTYLTISSVQDSNKSSNSKSSAIKDDNSNQDAVTTINANLQNSRSILDQRVSYSDILSSLAVSLPPEAAVESLSISDTSFGAPSIVKIKVKSLDIEPKLKTALNNNYFNNYVLSNQSPNPDGSSVYKFILTVNLTFNRVVMQ